MTAGSHLVRRQERAAALGTNAEDLEVVPGDELGPDRTGTSTPAQADRRDGRAEELREPFIVIAKVPIIGVRQAERASRVRFSEDNGEPSGTVDAGNRREREPLEQGEDGGVQAYAEREDADDGKREDGVLREAPDGVADVAHLIVQGIEPPRGPDPASGFGRQRDVAELPERRVARLLWIRALGDLLTARDGKVRADFFLEVLIVQAPPLQTLEPGHDPHPLLLAFGRRSRP